MKAILFLFFTTGAAPVTPEHHFATTAEFDDRIICEAVLELVKKNSARYRVDGFCVPKGSAGLPPDVRQRLQEKFPQ